MRDGSTFKHKCRYCGLPAVYDIVIKTGTTESRYSTCEEHEPRPIHRDKEGMTGAHLAIGVIGWRLRQIAGI